MWAGVLNMVAVQPFSHLTEALGLDPNSTGIAQPADRLMSRCPTWYWQILGPQIVFQT